jgi:hypothetical protein
LLCRQFVDRLVDYFFGIAVLAAVV